MFEDANLNQATKNPNKANKQQTSSSPLHLYYFYFILQAPDRQPMLTGS